MSEPSEAEVKAIMARISGLEIDELPNLNGHIFCAYDTAAAWHLKETCQLRAENERLRGALQDAALALDYSWGDFRIKQAEALIRVKEALHPLKEQQNEKRALI